MKQRTIKVKSAAILLKKFGAVFTDDDTCLHLLADLKWKDGFVCKHCGHDNWCHGKVSSSRRCTRCKHEESATAHTIFHHCRFSLKTAFELSLLICRIPDISSYELSRQVNLRHMTCYNFQKKMITCRQGQPENELFSKLLIEIEQKLEDAIPNN